MCSLSCTSVHYLSLVVLSSCNADQKLFCRQMQYVIVSTHFYADPTFLDQKGQPPVSVFLPIVAANDPASFHRQVAKLIYSGLVSRMFSELHAGL